MSFANLLDHRRLELSAIENDEDVDVNLAAATIMFAVIAADNDIDQIEVAYLVEILRNRHGLDSYEISEILRAAKLAVNNEKEIDSFLDLLTKSWNKQERTQLLDDMWQLATSDKTIRTKERLTIDRFATALELDLESITKARYLAEQKLELNIS